MLASAQRGGRPRAEIIKLVTTAGTRNYASAAGFSLADSDLPPTVLSHCRSGPGRPPAIMMLQSLASLRCQWAAAAAASVPVTVTDGPEVDY